MKDYWGNQYTGPIFRKFEDGSVEEDYSQAQLTRIARASVDFCHSMMKANNLGQYSYTVPVQTKNGLALLVTHVISGVGGQPLVLSRVVFPDVSPEKKPTILLGLYVWGKDFTVEDVVVRRAFCLEPDLNVQVKGATLIGTSGTWRLYQFTTVPPIAEGRLRSSIATNGGVANVVEMDPDPEYPWSYKYTYIDLGGGYGVWKIDTSTLKVFIDQGVESEIDLSDFDSGLLNCYYQNGTLIVDGEHGIGNTSSGTTHALDLDGNVFDFNDDTFLLGRTEVIDNSYIGEYSKVLTTEPPNQAISTVDVHWHGGIYYDLTITTNYGEFPFDVSITELDNRKRLWTGGNNSVIQTTSWAYIRSPFSLNYTWRTSLPAPVNGPWNEYWGRFPFSTIYDSMRVSGNARITNMITEYAFEGRKSLTYANAGLVDVSSASSSTSQSIYDAEGRYINTVLLSSNASEHYTTWNGERTPFNLTGRSGVPPESEYIAGTMIKIASESVDQSLVLIEATEYQHYGGEYTAEQEFKYWGIHNGEFTDLTELITQADAGLWFINNPDYDNRPEVDGIPIDFEPNTIEQNNDFTFMAITRPYAITGTQQ